MFMFNSVFLPFVNVNHWGDFSLIKIKSGSTSSPTIDLYVNDYFKPKQNIDKLEKTKFNVKHFAKRYEAYQPFALAALLVLLVEILLRITWFRRIP